MHKFLRFLESTCISSWSILKKFLGKLQENFEEIKWKREESFKWFQENYENILGKNRSNSKLMLMKKF